MAIYHRLNLGESRALDLEDYYPGIMDAVKSGFGEGWDYNPFWNMGRFARANPWQAQGSVWDGGMDTVAQAGVAGVAGMTARGYFDPAWTGGEGEVEIAPESQQGMEAAGQGMDESQVMDGGQAMDGVAEGPALNPEGGGNPYVEYMEREDARLVPEHRERRPRVLSLEEQAQRIELAGLTGVVRPQPEYDGEALAILMDNARERRTEEVLQKNLPGWTRPFSLAASFAAGALDPLNVLSGFIPVLGEARMINMLSRAHGAWGRAGVRALQGGLGGAVGNAALDPLIRAEQNSMQRDYDMWQSVMNIGFGAALGAAIAPAAGRVSEVRNARRGIIEPWQYRQPTRESADLMKEMARQLYRLRMGANPGQDGHVVFHEAWQAAMEIDGNMRHMSWASGQGIGEVYQQAKVRLLNGERFQQEVARLEADLPQVRQEYEDLLQLRDMAQANPHLRIPYDPLQVDLAELKLRKLEDEILNYKDRANQEWREVMGKGNLYMAGKRSDAASLEEFARQIIEENDQGKYYLGNPVTRPEAGLDNTPLELMGNIVNHIRRRQNDFNDWQLIPRIMERGEIWQTPPAKNSQAPGLAFIGNREDKKIVVLAEVRESVEGGRRLRINTLFETTEQGLGKWLEKKGAIPSSHDPGSRRPYPTTQPGRVHGSNGNGQMTPGDPHSSSGSLEYPSSPQTMGNDTAVNAANRHMEDGTGRNANALESHLDSPSSPSGNPPGKVYDQNDLVNFQERWNRIEQGRVAAREKLQRETEAWHALLDSLKERPEGNIPVLRETPLIMELIGAENHPLMLAPHAFDGVFNVKPRPGHHAHGNITKDILKQLPEAITNPIAIFRSASDREAFVFMINVRDSKGSTVVLPLGVNQWHPDKSYQMQLIKSVYAKDKPGIVNGEETPIPRDEWFYEQARKNLVYVNEKLWWDWTNGDAATSGPSPSRRAIRPIRRFLADNIASSEDLVNLQWENPTRYQMSAAMEDGHVNLMGAYTPASEANPVPAIRLFKSHDHTTIAHEFGHHIRSQYSQLAQSPTVDPLFKTRYQALQKRYGVLDDVWSRQQEEAFANDFVRDYLVRHKQPDPEMAAIFGGMRELALDFYETADALNLSMTNEARDVFNSMLTLSTTEAENRFHQALADLNTRRWENAFLNEGDLGPVPEHIFDEATSWENLERSTEETARLVENELNLMEQQYPDIAQAIRNERKLELAELQTQTQKLNQDKQLMHDLAMCYLQAEL